MFGYKIIDETHYNDLLEAYYMQQRAVECHRWFSCFTDLDIIWDYILGKRLYGGIATARLEYAVARNTDEYNKPIKPKRKKRRTRKKSTK